MNSRRFRLVPIPAALLAGALCGCMPETDRDDSALVVTENGAMSYEQPQSPERLAAVAQMRLNAEAGEVMPYPDAVMAEQTQRLAARPEPRSVSDAEAIQAELAAIARRQAGTVTPQELAALQARAAELRRIAADAKAATPQ